MVPQPASPPTVAELEAVARRVRVAVVRTVHAVQVGHLGGSLSEADILTALYFRVMRIRPEEPHWPDRDRFVLSKGHSSLGLYATLAVRGYLPLEELVTFDKASSRLQGHPDMTRLDALDMSTGSLGLGISAAVGIALGLRLQRREPRTFVLVGDGECQEGSVWEAAFVASRYGLDNLVAIVDHNRLQQFGWMGDSMLHRLPPDSPGELAGKWSAFGWRVIEGDGHDMAALVPALETAVVPDGRPVVVIAETVKGKGVSFAENQFQWHTKIPTDEELGQALRELGQPAERSADNTGQPAAARR